MVKVAPNDNLVPCVRDSYVKDHPHHDLIHNLIRAQELIRGAAQFFHLRRNAVVYSGYIRSKPDLFITINLWHGGVKVRSQVLADLGYGGVLHWETIGKLEEVVGWDFIGSLAATKQPCFAAAASQDFSLKRKTDGFQFFEGRLLFLAKARRNAKRRKGEYPALSASHPPPRAADPAHKTNSPNPHLALST